jgi:hypothetical protein
VLVAERPRVIGPDFMRRLLRHGTDIQAVWSVGHSADSDAGDAAASELLVFADRATLAQLRKRDDLHEPDVTLRVVVDGDLFEPACGGHGLSGSLARWAWREVAPGEAYYDESHWAAEAGSVVRVRRKAFRLWSRAAQL